MGHVLTSSLSPIDKRPRRAKQSIYSLPGQCVLTATSGPPEFRILSNFADGSLPPSDIRERLAAQFSTFFFVCNPVVNTFHVFFLWTGAIVAAREHVDDSWHLRLTINRSTRTSCGRHQQNENESFEGQVHSLKVESSQECERLLRVISSRPKLAKKAI